MKNALIVIGVIIVLVAAYFGVRSLYKSSYNTPTTSSNTSIAVTTTSVTISNFTFNPNDVSITKGQTVTFTNNDSTTHTVTSDTGAFDSGNLAPGNTFTHTFSDAGTFSYHCSIHTMMTGKIEVK